MSLHDLIVSRIRARGPMTVAEFMSLALYHPDYGYYARASRRSGRDGDFFTSVDVGPVFGELLAVQIAEMWRLLGSPPSFDLVEAAAGDGRLARDVLDAMREEAPACYAALRLHLVETSATARGAQGDTLGPHLRCLVWSDASLPPQIAGVVLANELLDALPVHAVVHRADGLREIRVGEADGRLVEVEREPSTSELEAYLTRVGAALEVGGRAEVGLEMERWFSSVGTQLTRGFLVAIDYGHEAAELYSAAHGAGTLTAYRRHTQQDSPMTWLANPGEQDLTAHVDLTGARLAAARAGLTSLTTLDQTYFLLGLGAAERLGRSTGNPVADLKHRLALKTLLLPGGLGSTHKVMIFGKDVGRPTLRAMSFRERLT